MHYGWHNAPRAATVACTSAGIVWEVARVGVLTRIFENFDFLRSSESTFFFSNPYKTPEMNELDIELSKKSKIIEIGSVEKKLRLFKVGGISKKSGNLRIFVQLIYFSENKTVPD